MSFSGLSSAGVSPCRNFGLITPKQTQQTPTLFSPTFTSPPNSLGDFGVSTGDSFGLG
jgi:hypothetical protein